MSKGVKVSFSHDSENVWVTFFKNGRRLYGFMLSIKEAEEFCKAYTRQVWAAQDARAALEEEDE